MKKSKIVAFVLTMAIIMLSIFVAGCSSSVGLDKPYGLSIDEYNRLSWVSVDDARSYIVSVTDANGATQEETSRRANYSLVYLQVGDYEIKIKAIGDGKKIGNSVWSETYYFHRDYETGCLYTLINNDSEYEIKSVGSAAGEIEIENSYRGKPVTSVGDSAFRGSRSVEKLILSKNINYIGASAFYNCLNLTEINIPDTVNFIGKSAFQSCSSLASITLPKGLTEISEYTFAYCRSLTEIDLTGIESIGYSAFTNCDKLEGLVIPESVTSLGDSAFSNTTSLKSVTFTSGLETLGNKSFSGCTQLEELNFSSDGSLKEIGQNTFSGCKALTRVILPEGLEVVGYGSFSSATNLEDVAIPSSVTRVGGYAFNNTKIYNEAIANGDAFVYVDNWLVQIARGNAESDCPNVKMTGIISDTNGADERIPDVDSSVDGGYQARFKPGVVGIADSAFSYCSSLIFAEIPLSVKFIGNYAFLGCENLYRINTLSGLKRIGVQAFKNCTKLLQLNFSEGLETIGREAFRGCTALVNPEGRNIIPQSVTQIEPDAFYEAGLWSMPDEYGVIYAGNWIVGYNAPEGGAVDDSWMDDWINGMEWRAAPKSQYDIVIGNPYYEQSGDDSSVNIADYAFFNINYRYYMMYVLYPELFKDSIVFPTRPKEGIQTIEGLEYTKNIGEGAFYGCNQLTTAFVGNNVKVIKDYTFYGCESLETVNIPYMLETIGKSAFYNCEKLKNVVNSEAQSAFPDFEGLNLYGCRVNTIGDYAFYGTAIREINFGNRLVNIGEVSFYNCENLTDVKLPDTVKEIKYATFARCGALKNVEMGSNTQTIGDYAFYGCKELSYFNIPDSVKTIGEYAFFDSGLQNVNFGSGLKKIGSYAFASTKLQSVTLFDSVEVIGEYAFRNCNELQTVTLPDSLQQIGLHAFYGCSNMTVYLQHGAKPDGWAVMWNSSYRPEVWGCKLSEDGSYVVSVTVGENTFANSDSIEAYGVIINAPARAGYVFRGWTTQENGVEVEYTANQLTEVPAGTTLYSVWVQQ